MGSDELRAFVWQGYWKGGAERTVLGMAQAFEKYHGIRTTLGVFERRPNIPLSQLVMKEVFPKRLTGYNAAWATWYLNKKGILDEFDITFSFGGFFLKTQDNFYACHECGDLDLLIRTLPFTSGIVAFPITRIHVLGMKRADLVLSLTRECDEFLERHEIKNYVRASNFVDTKIFKPMRVPRPSSKFNLLFVGRGEDPRKNLKTLIEACLRLEEKVNLYVVGTKGLNRKNIFYLGRVNDEELARWYNRCELLVIPSFWEGLPVVSLEAMACGTPVLASKFASMPEKLQKFIRTFNPYSREDLEKNIVWAIENYEEMVKISEKAHRVVVREFNKEKVTKEETSLIVRAFLKGAG